VEFKHYHSDMWYKPTFLGLHSNCQFAIDRHSLPSNYTWWAMQYGHFYVKQYRPVPRR